MNSLICSDNHYRDHVVRADFIYVLIYLFVCLFVFNVPQGTVTQYTGNADRVVRIVRARQQNSLSPASQQHVLHIAEALPYSTTAKI